MIANASPSNVRVLSVALLLTNAWYAWGQPATQPAAPPPERFVVRVTVDSLFLRCRADLNSTPVMQVGAGTLLLAEGKGYAHYNIIPPPDVFYFVSANYVLEKGAGRGVVTLTSGGLRVRAGSLVYNIDPNSADAVARIEDGAEVEILGRQDGWLKIRPPAGVYLYAFDDYVTRATPAEEARFFAGAGKATSRPSSRPTTAPSTWRRALDEIGQLIFREAGKPPSERNWTAIERQLTPIVAQREDAESAELAERWLALVRKRAAEDIPDWPQNLPTTRPGP